MIGLLVAATVCFIASTLLSLGWLEDYSLPSTNHLRVAAAAFSLSMLGIMMVSSAMLLWVPSRVRLVLSGVRLCHTLAAISSIGPFTLFGIDKLVLDNSLLGEVQLTFEKSGVISLFGMFITLFFANKFQKRYSEVYKMDVIDADS